MPKIILSLDGGGIRGAATARFLCLLEECLDKDYNTSLRKTVDLYAGTSTGSIIALALANTNLSMSNINSLYSLGNAEKIFLENKGWFEIDGINAPKYEGSGKTALLKSKLGPKAKIGKLEKGKHVLVVTYCINTRRPIVIKSTEDRHRDFLSYQVADASSAAPTYFPTVPIGIPRNSTLNSKHIDWLIDGGIVANNPTMCAICEARKAWEGVSIDDIRVLSIGTGTMSRKINGRESTKWGSAQWFLKGHIIDLMMDERIVSYQARTIMSPGNYIRVNADLSNQTLVGLPPPPDDAMDDIDEGNIERLQLLGEFWFKKYGRAAAELLTGKYTGPSLDRINPATGKPNKLLGTAEPPEQPSVYSAID